MLVLVDRRIIRPGIVMFLGGHDRRVPSHVAACAVAVLVSAGTEAQVPTPEPTPATAPKRLRLDIEGQVERLEEERRKDVPHFETRVEVTGKSPQVMLDRFLRGIELDCPPALWQTSNCRPP